MKKIVLFMAMLMVSLALVGCGMNKKDNVKDNAANDSPVEDSLNNDNNAMDVDEDDDQAGDTDDLGHNGEGHMEVAKEAADKVSELDEVDSATVIVTDNNAYVAIMMNNDQSTSDVATNDELPKELEDKVADKVREVKQDVDQVYVSLNPDFVERLTDYGKRIDEGEPIEGFFDEFGEAMRNVFPDAR